MPLTVMIVDDSRAMRRIQRNVVSQLGNVDVVEAEDGVSAIYQLKQRNFQVDLILLDWMMPRVDGLSFAKRLKANANLSWIPILMVTSVSDERKTREAWRTGIDGYLLKPFTKEMLLEAILSLDPRRKKLERALAQPAIQMSPNGKSFLQGLPRAMYSQILDMAEVITVEDRTPILFRGEPVPHFFFVLEGEVEEHRPAVDQNGASTRVYGPGECFAVTELMSGDRLGSNFVTSQSSKIARLQKPDFETLLLNYPEVDIALSRYLAAKTLEADAQATGATQLAGSLDLLDVPDLVQALNLRQATGVIELPDIDSYIELSGGQVVAVRHPRCSSDDGKAAFFQIIEEKPKKFRLLSKQPSNLFNVDITTPKLLLEYVQWVDEKTARPEES